MRAPIFPANELIVDLKIDIVNIKMNIIY